MEAMIIHESRKHDWDKFVEENSNAIAWQSYDWSNVLARHYKFRFYPIALYDGRDICGILPLYHMKTNLEKKTRLYRSPTRSQGGSFPTMPRRDGCC